MPKGWTAKDLPDLRRRRVVVTGANSGLGREAAAALAGAGAAVTLAVRDEAKGEQAAQGMTGTVEVRRLDLADLASVRSFAEGWEGPLDVLIDNAGVMAVPLTRTAQGFEAQIGVNHLGHFALTALLLPVLTDRVVVVSSAAHRMGRIDLDDLNWQRRRYRRWAAYGQSKLANLLFVWELQRRFDEIGSPLRAVAAHPGYAATNLQGRTANPLVDGLAWVGNRALAQSAAAGALPTLYAATADLPGRTFVGPDGPTQTKGSPTVVTASRAARDDAGARRLWDLSEQLTGVSWPLAGSAPAGR